MQPKFFATPSDFRAWFVEQQDLSPETAPQELLVGFYKKGSGKPSITWPEAVDEALCFGWIDGRGKSIDETSYTIRFTPRKPKSIWSTVNINRVAALTESGLMQPAGLKAFEARQAEKSGIYSHEQTPENVKLSQEYEQRFQANSPAWEFFQAQAPSYQKAAIWWVISAKKEETKERRLTTLIQDSASGRTVPPLTRAKSK